MREYKFRQPRLAFSGRFLDWFYWGFVEEGAFVAPLHHHLPSYQYTGLKDKNGVEIYEGDVLKALNGHLFEIVWYDGLACFDARSIGCHDEMMNVGWPLAEVIGNIYENPELESHEK